MKKRSKLFSLLVVVVLALGLCPIQAFAETLTGQSVSFSGNSGFSYRGYTQLSYNSNWANGYQYTSCTSTSAPIGNVRSLAYVCSSSGQQLAVGNWNVNKSTLSKGSSISSTANFVQYSGNSVSVYAMGYSSCWRNGGWYDVLSQKTGTATVYGGRSADQESISLTNESSIYTNDSNQLVGTILDINQGFPVELIKVKATNGSDGYVYYSEQEKALNEGMETPEEAVVTILKREKIAIEALQSSLGRNLSQNSVYYNLAEIDFNDAKAVLDAYYECLDNESAAQSIDLFNNILDKLLEDGSLKAFGVDADVLENALFEANEAVATYIPVYAEDGMTVVGEFAIGGL